MDTTPGHISGQNYNLKRYMPPCVHHNEISSHTCQDDCHQKVYIQMTNIGKDVEKREPLDTVGIVIWYSHCGKHYGDSSKKLKIGLLLYDPSIPLLGIYLKKMKTLIKKDICTPKKKNKKNKNK